MRYTFVKRGLYFHPDRGRGLFPFYDSHAFFNVFSIILSLILDLYIISSSTRGRTSSIRPRFLAKTNREEESFILFHNLYICKYPRPLQYQSGYQKHFEVWPLHLNRRLDTLNFSSSLCKKPASRYPVCISLLH